MNAFERGIDRRSSNSVKWSLYPPDVLPMWVADMDFEVAEPVVKALRARVEERVFGYDFNPRELKSVIVERLKRNYGWEIREQEIVALPGVVPGFNVAIREFLRPNEGLLLQTPVYRPILKAAELLGRESHAMELSSDKAGRYYSDADRFDAALSANTRMFLLCNPHNPVGRVFTRGELESMAAACLRNDVLICSDEIHCDIVYGGSRHIPIASISDEISERTITLMSPGKTFNTPGLNYSFAVISNAELRKRFKRALHVSGSPETNIMGSVAALAAYADGGDWLAGLLEQLESNRDFLCRYVREHLEGVRVWSPEGTYLAWLDFRGLAFPANQQPFDYLLETARVALSRGDEFGPGGSGFGRINFGCPSAQLLKGLERIRGALEQLRG